MVDGLILAHNRFCKREKLLCDLKTSSLDCCANIAISFMHRVFSYKLSLSNTFERVTLKRKSYKKLNLSEFRVRFRVILRVLENKL